MFTRFDRIHERNTAHGSISRAYTKPCVATKCCMCISVKQDTEQSVILKVILYRHKEVKRISAISKTQTNECCATYKQSTNKLSE